MEDVVSGLPLITNDAVVFGILMAILLVIFKTTEMERYKGFYKVIPALLLCYFVPSLFSTLGIISPKWIDVQAATAALAAQGFEVEGITNLRQLRAFVINNEVDQAIIAPFIESSKLYFVASRYLLPASLVLLTLSINLREVFRLGPKALIMFLTGTVGVIIGGPLAILLFRRCGAQ